MERKNLNKENLIIWESKISQSNDNFAREKFKILSSDDPERYLSYRISKEHWNPDWPDWNTRGSDYGRNPSLITEQVKSCKRLIRSIDAVFLRKPTTKLNKSIVEVFCEAAEHNPIVAFITEAYKETFSKEGKVYYEEWKEKNKNVIPKSKGFRKWMILSLVEQRVTDWTPGIIDFDHIDEDIESKIYTEIQRCHGF